jgi:3-(3-hydroxy-phenyl)propionate hydroxylase
VSTAQRPDPVVVVGAGPVGCTAALLLADCGVPVILLERHLRPHPLPRAVHLDDEVVRILHRVGVSGEFLARSRPATGLRLVDGRRRVLAEFPRETTPSANGFPVANMFHQPDLEALLLARVGRHPLVTFRRGVEVSDIRVAGCPDAVHLTARTAGDQEPVTVTGRLLLGCDGANSTVRERLGVPMDDLRFTERWLVIDARTGAELDTWGGVEQVCGPGRAATFMRVVGDRYRWEFQLRDGEDEADLIRPEVLGRLLRPWTGRDDLDGLDLVRSASYTFRARLARRFQVGPVFLLGDAAHLTPPFIGQGLGAGLRDAANLAWKVERVLSGRATPDLLATYEAERRPHARALVRRAVLVGWAMTGGQDRAARVRRVALALAVRSGRVRDALAHPATPPLARGALGCPRLRVVRRHGPFPVGALMPNAVVRDATGADRRLDEVLGGRLAAVTGAQPSRRLIDTCREKGLLLVRVHPDPGAASRPAPAAGCLDITVAGPQSPLHPLVRNRQLQVAVRPDGVIGAVSRRDPPAVPLLLPQPAPATAPRAVLAR